MLRYQLNPHFLFNTLNAVSALILDIEKARFGDRLSLRYELGPDVQNALLDRKSVSGETRKRA